MAAAGNEGHTSGETRYFTDAGGNRVAVTTGFATASEVTRKFLVDPNTSYAQVVQERDGDGIQQSQE